MFRSILLSFVMVYSVLCLTAKSVSGYEAWIDDNYQPNQGTATIDKNNVSLTFDYNCISGGLHYINFRFIDSEGNWSAVYRKMVCVPGPDSETADFMGVECWIDEDYEAAKIFKELVFYPDVSTCKPGLHYLNYRTINTRGCYGLLKRIMFILPDEKDAEDENIIGYAYGFGGNEKYVPLSEPDSYVSLKNITVDFPSLKGLWAIKNDESFMITPELASIKRNVEVPFTLRALGDKGNWSQLWVSNITIDEELAHKYENLCINTPLVLDIPKVGDFVAAKFTASKDYKYKIRTSSATNLLLYSEDGSIIENFIPEQTLSEIELKLTEGTYYCIAHGMQTIDPELGKESYFTLLIYEKVSNITPAIKENDGVVTIIGGADGDIYYTTDGTEPTTESNHYEGEFKVDRNCTIKVIVVVDGKASNVYTYEVDTFKVAAPTAEIIDYTVTLSCETEESEIYYTLDGTDPAVGGILYTEPIEITADGTLSAVAKREGYNDSEIISVEVKAPMQQCANPTFELAGTQLTITTTTKDAVIYYTIGKGMPTEASDVYLAPIELTDNREVNAIACADGCIPSEVATFTPDIFACDEAQISYDGRYATISTTTAKAEIHYTLDGTTPTEESDLYLSPIDVNGIGTIRAIVTREYFNAGTVAEYVIPVYYDGERATVAEAGSLDKGFGWCEPDEIESLTVTGTINEVDFATIGSLTSLKYLDIADAQCENGVPSRAFANTSLVTVSLAAVLSSVGESLWDGCENLTAVIWNAKAQIPASVFTGLDNPNLLLYVDKAQYAPSSISNVVAGGYAETVTLTDGANYNFYCPREFTAGRITYTHQNKMTSGTDKSAGWETLALPYDVQRILHDNADEITPFAVEDGETMHFWLYELGEKGFVPAASIHANTPYIISMPNNDIYDPTLRLNKAVTFIGENVIVPVTKANVVEKGGYIFVPTTMHTDKSHRYAINLYEETDGYLPGGGFVYELRDLNPFEAYFTHEANVAPKKAFGIFDLNDDASAPAVGIDPSNIEIYTLDGRLVINAGVDTTVYVYSLSGVLVKTIDAECGITVVDDLVPGFYIVNNQKVVIK